MSERFEVVQDPRVQIEYFIYDNENKISENITDFPFDDQDVCSRIVILLNEQQDTISQLQDLCGKSDYENAKLRIENKKLKDDLHNCRLNKNIISEKLKMWQDVHKEYDIYNINDFEELMKNVKQKQ